MQPRSIHDKVFDTLRNVSHPYLEQPSKAYWKQAVAERSPLHMDDLYEPRFPIDGSTRISAAGSCFAQHIGRQFKDRNFRFMDQEPPPDLLDPAEHARFGFDLYSARYGNVYSARQLAQLFARAAGELDPVDQEWTDGERWYDPYRPTVEPDGFATREELVRSRDAHLRAVDRILADTDLFVFTFGLTEAWRNTVDGMVYPTCPGTVHGEFDPSLHEFVNFGYPDVLADFEAFIRRARAVNPQMRFLVTVSPVPLTATASGQHVLTATTASKSVLRAVCAELYARYDFLDYFPSYELVTSHPMRGMFFDPNLRTVASRGVAHVMDTFFAAHPLPEVEDGPPADEGTARRTEDDVVCEEALLEVFGS